MTSQIEFTNTGNTTHVTFEHGGKTVYFADVKNGRDGWAIVCPDHVNPAISIHPLREAALDAAAQMARDWIAA